MTMRSRYAHVLLVLVAAAVFFGGSALHGQAVDDVDSEFLPDSSWGVIDVAILLDTSGSMEHLIDAARVKLWDIVNDLALADPTPRLRVGLVTFGHQDNPHKAGWVKVETDLTEDLDLVSELLFSLTADGGAEYVGRVLQTALQDLSWTEDPSTLKLVFLAGNEPADQDKEVSFRDMAQEAYERGIEVNAIFCGNATDEQAATWKEVAELARSRFATINHRQGAVMVSTPFDEELAELGDRINKTYVPYGESGAKRREMQTAQDENAKSVSVAVAASRAQAKSSPLYAPDWDLVDAVAAEDISLYDLDQGQLPDELRSMSFEELYVYLDEKHLEREELRGRIAELGRKRSEYIAKQSETKGLDDSTAFDGVVRRVIRERAEEKGFTYPE
jgi:hypothetical protein